MATATAPVPPPETAPHRFTVAEYHRIASAGVLGEDDRVELIDGQIFDRSPISPGHAYAVDCCNRVFSAGVGGDAVVRVQNPLALGDYDEPEPDVALVSPPGSRYASTHPGAADVLLLVEVAESSLAYDQSTKAALYAAAGIREVWVVNLPAGVLEVYRDASPSGYQDRQTHQRAERVTPLAFSDLEITVADLLPPRGPGS
ncbi:MAG TPA: Uma2 family endonuclease [Armatimonadota bacterium]|jgi:Uma2 family endonuclease|nr:Uma2 family endonuclease [Armatimonadota bacterium]